MKSRNIIFLILIFILAISSVSAEDVNETDVNPPESVEDVGEEPVGVGEVGSMGDLTIDMYGGGDNTLINLTKDYVSNQSEYYESLFYDLIEKGIPISDSMTINGNGHYIDGQYGTRIFNIAYSDIVLNNITFKNGYWDYGGAIYVENSNCIIANCVFESCIADYGGAIYSLNSNLTIINTTFMGNGVYFYGGAIGMEYSNCIVSNCVFEKGIAHNGAAMFCLNSNSTIVNTTFKDNEVWFSGGAIYQMYGDLSIDKSYFLNNTAEDGGAICIDAYRKFQLSNSNFTNNTAIRYGGAIATLFNAGITSSNNKFKNNAGDIGDDIYHISLSEVLNITNYVSHVIQYIPDEITEIPAYYNLADYGLITSIKDQGQEGNCWSFAAMAALESALLKATGIAYNFSENNLKNLAAMYSDYGRNSEPNSGGSYWNSVGYFASWLGPVDEEDDPYYDGSSVFSNYLYSMFHVQDIAYISRSDPLDLNTIKEAILKYGAVASTIYWDSSYYDGPNCYCPISHGIDHAVTIVGWNDTYSRYNFKQTPAGDGAWIIKNSWGDTEGDNGFFYVSYYDQTFALNRGAENYVFILNTTVNYENIYQHEFGQCDNFYWDSQTHNIDPSEITPNVIWARNVFTAEKDEFIAAVSTLFHYDFDYDLYINVTHNGVSKVKLTQSGSCGAGYHTIKLNEYVAVQKGDTFSVTIKYTGCSFFPVSSDDDRLRSFSYPGISYSSWNGETWVDLSQFGDVACIKAFAISKINSTLVIDTVTPSEIENYFNITVRVYDEFGELVNNGNVTFNINNTIYTVNLTDGVGVLNIALNKSGKYNFDCLFSASNYYSSVNASGFTIYKHSPDLNLIISDIDYLDSFKVNVTLNSRITGNVTVKIDDEHSKVLKIVNGSAVYSFDSLKAGDYNIYVSYLGDSLFNGSSLNLPFKVRKISPQIVINSISDKEYGKDVLLTFSIADVEDNVTVNIYSDNVLITSKSTNSNSVSFKGLDAASYTVNFVYKGDNNYNPQNINTTFKIYKSTSSISLNPVTDINYLKGITFTPTLTNGTSGTYQLLKNSNVLKSGQLSSDISFDDLTAGNYTFKVVNSGDKNHNQSSISANFKVLKIDSQLKITQISNVAYGEVFTIQYSSLEGDVNLSIYKNSKLIASKINDNTFTDLPSGNYTAVLTFIDNDNYFNTEVTSVFSVFKASSSINVFGVKNITYGDVLNLNVDLINGSEGNYKLNGIQNDITSDLSFSALKAGNYTLIFTNDGDANHNPSNATFKFQVFKASPDFVINPVETVVYSKNTTLNFNFKGTGKVNVTVFKNNQVILNTIVDGNFEYKFESGEYFLKAEYLGDENYTGMLKNTTFTVLNATSTVNVNLKNITYGDTQIITADLINSTVGSYRLIKDNNILLEGSVVDLIEFKQLNAGNYTLIITNFGDANHDKSTLTRNFTIFKAMPDLIINQVLDVVYNNNVSVSFTVNDTATGNFNITVYDDNGVVLTNITSLKTHKFSLDAGSYMVNVSYLGDENYIKTSKTTTFTVYKASSDIKVLLENITYSQVMNINVDLINSSTGNYNLVYNGENSQSGDVTSLISFDALNAGNYTLFIENKGDLNHNKSSLSCNFTVFKALPVLVINDISDVTYNQKAIVSFSINDTASGNFNITVYNGDNIVLTNITSLKAHEYILDAGNYLVTVSYLGDENYLKASKNSTFTVKQAESKISVEYTNITYGDTFNMAVDLTNSTEGTYELINIKSGEFTDSISFENLAAGNYTLIVKNSPDKNHKNSTLTVNFTVFKALPDLAINNILNVTYNEKAIVSFMINDTATGKFNITVYNDGNIVLTNITSLKSHEFMLDAGNYLVSVSYLGDENYLKTSKNSTFTVNKAESEINVEYTNITYGETANIKVDLVNASNGTYEMVNLKSGNFTNLISFENLDAGNYTLIIKNNVDKNHKASNLTLNFTVYKAESFIGVSFTNITYGERFNMSVVLLNATNGTYELVNVQSGEFTNLISFENLDAGNYTLIVKNNPDKNHNGFMLTLNFTVFKASPDLVIFDISNVVYPQKTVVSFDINDDANSNFNISVYKDNLLVLTNITSQKSHEFNMDAGNYSVNITYLGDENYLKASKNLTFKVNKANSSINVLFSNITYGEIFNISVDMVNATNGTYDLVNVQSGDFTNLISFDNLNAGNYTLIIKNNVDKNHNQSTKTLNFTVFKASPDLVINNILNATYPQKTNVSFDIKGDATPLFNISLYKNESLILTNITPLKSHEFSLDAGDYLLAVDYMGDENYLETSKNLTFTVSKAKTDISISQITDTVYGKDVNISYTLSADGNVTLRIYKNNRLMTSKLSNTSETLKNPDSAFYRVEIDYAGDANHMKVSQFVNFTVAQASSAIVVDSYSNITYLENFNIKVTLINGSSGSYQIYKYNKVVRRGIISSSISVGGLEVGDYSIVLNNNGNSNHESSSLTLPFKVFKATPTITIPRISSRVYGNTVPVSFSISNSQNGEFNVSVYKNNVLITSRLIKSTSCEFDSLESGSYRLSVTYLGDDNYNPCTKTATFNVLKASSSVKIRLMSSLVYGFNSYASFKVVNGSGTYDVVHSGVVIKSGSLSKTVSLSDLNAGTYTINAYNNGDANHSSSTDSFTFTLRKATPELTVNNIDDLNYLDNLTISFTLDDNLNGKINVSLIKDNILVESRLINGRETTFNYLNAGDYVVKVTYPGDENHMDVTQSLNFAVDKSTSSVSLTGVSNITYGDVLKINVDYTNSTSLNYILISDKNITGNASDVLEFNNLAGGDYIVKVFNNGDENHRPSSCTAKFSVLKADSGFSVNLIPNMNWNEILNITYAISGRATGHVNLTLNDIERTYDLFEEITFNDLKSGQYTLTLTYSGDNNFTSAEQITDFEIKPVVSYVFINTDKKCEITSTGHDYTLIYNGKTMTVNVYPDAIFVNGKLYAGISNLMIDNYEMDLLVKIQAVIDDNYNGSEASDVIRVNTYGVYQISQYDTQITLILPSDASGSGVVSVNGIGYEFDISGGVGGVNIEGLADGVYTYTLTYYGDVKYNSLTVQGSLTVYHPIVKVKPKLVASKKTYKASLKVKKYKVTLKGMSKAKLTLKINKKTYKATTNSKGKAVFKIRLKKEGSYKAKIKYNGDKYHESVSKTVRIIIKK